MKYRKLGCSSLEASVLGIGGLHFGVFCDQATTTSIIHRALDLGVNFIDTAPMYGHGYSEDFVKNAIQGCRDKVLIGTKVGLEPLIAEDGTFGVSVVSLSEERIRFSLEKSLRALGTEYIDVYQIHAFDPKTPLEETLGTLDALVREGKLRSVGCSNYSHVELELTSTVMKGHGWTQFVAHQVHYNLIERRADQAIVPACRSLGIGLICFRALARGILTGKYKPNQPLPEGSRAVTSYRVRRWLSEPTLLLVDALDQFARRRGHTVTELSIAWLLSRPNVSTILVGVRDLGQLELCARATGWVLSDDEIVMIDQIVESYGLMAQVNSMPENFLEV